MRERMVRFMQGRYGVDALSRCLMWFAMAFVIVDMFARTMVLSTIGVVMILYVYYRMFSKNYIKRQAENGWFLRHTYKLRMFFLKQKDYAKIRKDYHIYTCSQCGQKIKIPRNKGKIMVTCPKCHNQFQKRS